VRGGQITVDVDLDEQVLSVWLEDAPVFVTLISSGKRNDETPPGIYRIENKRAFGKMQSNARARDPYYVDAVPWTMYFQGRYALHASYWHDMFGHRMSHGCVNLSPRDAKRVFELTTPTLPNGWLLVYEHEDDPGAVVRVRKAGAPTPDLRGPLESGVWSEDQSQ
jgi:lipoprotein-anchoring transpeptidase ErfK/SrfK